MAEKPPEELIKQLARNLGECHRKGQRRADTIVHLLDKIDRQNHEIKKLTELLVWVARTEAGDYREVIQRKIPRALRTADELPEPEMDNCA